MRNPNILSEGWPERRKARAWRHRTQSHMERFGGEHFLDAFLEPMNALVKIASLEASAPDVAETVGAGTAADQQDQHRNRDDSLKHGYSSFVIFRFGPRARALVRTFWM